VSFHEEKVAEILAKRLFREILYELQTGGGIGFDGVQPSDHQRETLASIHRTVTNLKMLSSSAPQRVAHYLTRPNQRILDVGAGTARWSIAIARASDAHVTAIDVPEQIPLLQRAVDMDAAVKDRFTIIGIDLFGDHWLKTFETKKFELILVANVVHLFDERRNRLMLRRLLPLLCIGGTIAIIDQVLEEDPDWPRWAALYALGVLHCAPGGHLFALREYAEWFKEHGSWNLVARSVSPLPPLTLILAQPTIV
jgi:SAM-dependent methyltransferase